MAVTSTPQKTSRLAGLFTGPGLLLRQLRSDLVVICTLLAVVFLTGLFLAAMPMLFNQMSDDGLKEAVNSASPLARNISTSLATRYNDVPDDPFQRVETEGVRFLDEEMPESVQSVINGQQYVTDSPRYTLSSLPDEAPSPFPRFLRLRYQQDIDEQIELVAGKLPGTREPVVIQFPVATEANADEDSSESDAEGEETPAEPEIELVDVEMPLYEIAVTQSTLDDLRIGLGDRLIMQPDQEDTLYRGIPISVLDYMMAVEVSGIIEIIEPDAAYWNNDLRLHRAEIEETADFVLVYATGLMSPDDYGRLLDDTIPALWNYTWRYFVDADAMNAGMVNELASDLRNLEVQYQSMSFARAQERSLSTGLSRILTAFTDQRQLTISVLALASIGLFAVALAVIAVLAALISVRRRDTIVLLRSRGASHRQLLASRITEGLVLSVPAALVALIAAILLVPGRRSNLSFQITLVLAVASTLIVVAASLSLINRDLGSLLQDRELVGRPSVRRRVFEWLIVVLAVGAVILLRRRGLSGGAIDGSDTSFDPLLAAVPALLGLAVGILTLKLYPFIIRVFSWLGSLRSDLVPYLGFRRILQQPRAARLPILVILLAVSVAVFASVIRYSIEEGQQEASWQEVGADYLITSVRTDGPVSRLLDLSSVDSIEAIATGYRDQSAEIVHDGTTPQFVDFLALDVLDYAAVTAGTRADAHFPEVISTEQLITDIGTESNPIPAIVSKDWVGDEPLNIGDTFPLKAGRTEATFIVREIRDRFYGLPPGEPFVVANLDSVQEINRRSELRPTAVYIRANAESYNEILTTMDQQTFSTRLFSRSMIYNDVHAAPLVSGASRGFQLAVILAALYAILAAIAALALTSNIRKRDFGFLRTLGLSTRQALKLTIIEQLPPVIIAAVAGSLLGVGIALLIEPGIDLNAFTGPGLEAKLYVNWSSIVIISTGLVLAVFVSIAIYSMVSRDENLGNVLRVGDE